MTYQEIANRGIWLACGVLCIWPILLSVLSVVIYRKVTTQGWAALLPGWFKRLPPYE